MSSPTIDYDALAKQHGAIQPEVDYDAIAAKHGASIHWRQGSPEEAAQLQQMHTIAPAEDETPPNSAVGGFFRRAGGMLKSGIMSGLPVPSMGEVTETAHNPTFGNKLRLFAHSTPGIAPLSRMIEGQVGAEKEAAQQIGDQWSHGESLRPLVTLLSMADPFATGAVTNVNQLEDEGRNREAIGQGAFDIGTLLAGSKTGGKALSKVSPRGMFGKNMDIAAPNEPFTRRELLQGARDHGINLDLADASGAGVPKMLKQATMHGLSGSGPFEANLENNVGALDQWGTKYLDNFSKFSGENAGARIQDALKTDYATRKNAASQNFEALDKSVGSNSIDGSPTVEAAAQKIMREMQPYYEKHPELIPKQAWGIVKDLANRQQVQVARPGQTGLPWKSEPFSWSELHQLRSDLMDIYRNNPDLVKSRADSWLQQMVKTIDDTMTGAASKLSPADKWQFRQANETWEGLKQTYDNPQHPLYWAVREAQPSKVPGKLLSQQTPEFARQMKSVLGPEFGDLQRAAAEDILGNDRTGAGYDFKTMPGRLKRYDPAYLHDLLGPQGARDLSLMSRTGMTVTKDINPSGSGKLLQKHGELTALVASPLGPLTGHPVGMVLGAAPWIEQAAQRVAAKGINSPRAVDYLTSPRRSSYIPRAVAIANAASAADQEWERRVMEERRTIKRPVEMGSPR